MLTVLMFPVRSFHKGSVIKSLGFKSCCSDLYADEKITPVKSDTNENAINAENQVSDNTLYKVMGIILIIWIGLAVFLFLLDRKVSSLEKDLKDQQG